ncbi:MAG: MBL fold metallo-hydrolase [Bacteroidales bacterium]|nr:MBL fold metallo-hydrolase [Bacteroidales bacterium]MCF8327400.1 MBL fold metallo-hydrolase [Bacteroidales bacterium]
MIIQSINAENWKMDGGAVFGVVPKAIWEKLYPADENNLVSVTSRCLLVDKGDRKILIDTGMGKKQNEKYYKYKYLFGTDELLLNMHKLGYMPEEITDVLLTHLHDDHVGGAVHYNKSGELMLTFPNAQHYVSREQYDWAVNPNPREAASYFKENFEPIRKAGKLVLLERDQTDRLPGMELRFYDGHTRGQIIPVITQGSNKIAFMADFIPSVAHIPLPYIASVDVEPLKTLQEKESFLKEAVHENYILFFQHDFHHECCTVKETNKGIRADQMFKLTELDKK